MIVGLGGVVVRLAPDGGEDQRTATPFTPASPRPGGLVGGVVSEAHGPGLTISSNPSSRSSTVSASTSHIAWRSQSTYPANAGLVDELVALSDHVLFSAATPGQGGFEHDNEQPHQYCVGRFEERGYAATTSVRSHFARDKDVASWYHDNLLGEVLRELERALVIDFAGLSIRCPVSRDRL
jgi:hypothetical protein